MSKRARAILIGLLIALLVADAALILTAEEKLFGVALGVGALTVRGRLKRFIFPRVNYYSYLRSKAWSKKRLEAIQQARYKCESCGARGQLEVHHKTYTRLGRERRSDLVALCRRCHRRAHRWRLLRRMLQPLFSRRCHRRFHQRRRVRLFPKRFKRPIIFTIFTCAHSPNCEQFPYSTSSRRLRRRSACGRLASPPSSASTGRPVGRAPEKNQEPYKGGHKWPRSTLFSFLCLLRRSQLKAKRLGVRQGTLLKRPPPHCVGPLHLPLLRPWTTFSLRQPCFLRQGEALHSL